MTSPKPCLRVATAGDAEQLISLWDLLFRETGSAADQPWKERALDWFARTVGDSTAARFPLVDINGAIVATAIGTLELGVPNPHCPRGRAVRLANVVTVPEHRGNGYATLLLRDVIAWADAVDADRVDLSTTPEGQRIYEKAGFVLASAPRMKLVLSRKN